MKKGLFLALIGSFLGICAYLFVAFYSAAETAAIRHLNDEQLIHAKQAARGIEDFFQTWTGILRSFSRMDEIISVDSDGMQYMRLFYEAHHEQIRSITRVDEGGRILHTVPHNAAAGSDISNQKHMQQILRDHRPVVSDVFKTVQGFYGIALHVPVFKGPAFKGTIAIVIDFKNLARRYLEIIQIGETGYAWVISRDGTQLYSPVPGFAGKSVFENCRDFPSILVMVDDMLKGHEGTSTYFFDRIADRTIKPVKKYAVYRPVHIENTFWSIVVASSEDEVLSSIASFRNRLVLVIGLILFGGVLLSTTGVKAWLIVAEEAKRKRAEADLAEAHQRLVATIESMTDAFVSLDKDWRYTYVNSKAGQIFQREPASLIGKHIWTEFPEGEGQPFHRAYEKALRDQQALLLEEYYPPYDKWFENRIFPSPAGLAIFFSDITERKKTEQELEKHREHLEELVKERTAELQDSRKALINIVEDLKEKTGELAQANEKLKEVDRLKSLFIASMSHELRTPLNSIIGFTGILLQGLAGPMNEEQKKQLGMVKGSSEHLLSLITDIIDLGKIEAGRIDLSAEAFDLSAAVRAVMQSFPVVAEGKGLKLKVDAPERLMISSDPRRVRQVLVNLVGNAVKFTENGSVGVSLEIRNNMVEVSVRDTGPGIKDADMARLFQSFSQVVTAGVAKHEGSGLGLYLSKRLVNLLGGEIRAESEYGKGSVFRFTLPVDQRKGP